MTSKEALDRLLKNIEVDMCSDEWYECIEAKNIIEKDLEILEILKNKQVNIHFDLVVKDTYEEYLAGVKGSKVILTEKEWNKLKEWFNGKQRT